jgi:hypothetical protein
LCSNAAMLTAAPRHRLSSATFALLVALGMPGMSGCDDDKPKPADQRSVIEGGKADSEAGKKLEDAKQKIEGAEQKLQERDDRIFEAAQDEKVERGVP